MFRSHTAGSQEASPPGGGGEKCTATSPGRSPTPVGGCLGGGYSQHHFRGPREPNGPPERALARQFDAGLGLLRRCKEDRPAIRQPNTPGGPRRTRHAQPPAPPSLLADVLYDTTNGAATLLTSEAPPTTSWSPSAPCSALAGGGCPASADRGPPLRVLAGAPRTEGAANDRRQRHSQVGAHRRSRRASNIQLAAITHNQGLRPAGLPERAAVLRLRDLSGQKHPRHPSGLAH